MFGNLSVLLFTTFHVFENCSKCKPYLIAGSLISDLNLDEFHRKVCCKLAHAYYKGFLHAAAFITKPLLLIEFENSQSVMQNYGLLVSHIVKMYFTYVFLHHSEILFPFVRYVYAN